MLLLLLYQFSKVCVCTKTKFNFFLYKGGHVLYKEHVHQLTIFKTFFGSPRSNLFFIAIYKTKHQLICTYGLISDDEGFEDLAMSNLKSIGLSKPIILT